MNAQNPTIDSPVCTVQARVMPPAPATYEIKGTHKVINLPAGTMAVNSGVTFEKKAAGAAQSTTLFVVNQVTSVVAGTATFDTGNQSFTPAPVAGEQYRIMVTGTYTIGGPPQQTFQLGGKGSTPVTPVP